MILTPYSLLPTSYFLRPTHYFLLRRVQTPAFRKPRDRAARLAIHTRGYATRVFPLISDTRVSTSGASKLEVGVAVTA
jgi:hypothetical protein